MRYMPGRFNVSYIEAPYQEMVRVLGDDGTKSPRDDYKCMCQWEWSDGGDEWWEVYDYKIGKCYDPDGGLEREDIDQWHVQGTEKGIGRLLRMFQSQP